VPTWCLLSLLPASSSTTATTGSAPLQDLPATRYPEPGARSPEPAATRCRYPPPGPRGPSWPLVAAVASCSCCWLQLAALALGAGHRTASCSCLLFWFVCGVGFSDFSSSFPSFCRFGRHWSMSMHGQWTAGYEAIHGPGGRVSGI
jgi:hypothetical protein